MSWLQARGRELAGRGKADVAQARRLGTLGGSGLCRGSSARIQASQSPLRPLPPLPCLRRASSSTTGASTCTWATTLQRSGSAGESPALMPPGLPRDSPRTAGPVTGRALGARRVLPPAHLPRPGFESPPPPFEPAQCRCWWPDTFGRTSSRPSSTSRTGCLHGPGAPTRRRAAPGSLSPLLSPLLFPSFRVVSVLRPLACRERPLLHCPAFRTCRARSILDVGCGIGGSSRILAKKFPDAKARELGSPFLAVPSRGRTRTAFFLPSPFTRSLSCPISSSRW